MIEAICIFGWLAMSIVTAAVWYGSELCPDVGESGSDSDRRVGMVFFSCLAWPIILVLVVGSWAMGRK